MNISIFAGIDLLEVGIAGLEVASAGAKVSECCWRNPGLGICDLRKTADALKYEC